MTSDLECISGKIWSIQPSICTTVNYLTTGDCEMQTQSTYKSRLTVNYAIMHGLLQGSTALMAAAAWGHVTVVKVLLTHQADPAMQNKKVQAQQALLCKLHVCCRVLTARNKALGGESTQVTEGEGGGGGVCKHLSALCALTDVFSLVISQHCKLVKGLCGLLLTADAKQIQCRFLDT